MKEPDIHPERFRKTFLLLLAVGISLLFLAMIRSFLVALLMAAILAAMAYPLFERFTRWFGGRPRLGAAATVVLGLIIVILPLLGFGGLLATQAIEVTQAARPVIERLINEPNEIDGMLEGLPFYEAWAEYTDDLLSKAGDIAGSAGTFLVGKLADTTRGTAVFLFLLFITHYAMYFFLLDGRTTLNRILYYMPLKPEDEERMVEKFVSVTRATVKGSLIIGVVQGVLAGLAFMFAGITGWAFWGTVMAVLSVIPGVGAALVWIPAVVYLFAVGETGPALAVGIWCAAVVGTVDNVLRPILVGKDTKMPDLLILLSTLGGIVLFGVLGFIIGPIVAALFLIVWEIYGTAFADVLPEVPDLDFADAEAAPVSGAARTDATDATEAGGGAGDATSAASKRGHRSDTGDPSPGDTSESWF